MDGIRITALGGGFTAFALAVLLGVQLPGWTYDQLPLSVSVLSAAGTWWAARAAPQADRQAWRLFALGLSAWALGDVVYNLYRHLRPDGEPPFPSWADVFYLLYAPLVTLGIWRRMRPAASGLQAGLQSGPQLTRLLLDIATVIVTVFVMLWHFAYADAVAESEHLPGLLVNLSYPVQDSLMISLVILIALQTKVSLSRAAIVWLNLGFLFNFVGDVAYAVFLPEPYSLTNQVMDPCYTFCQASFGVAAIWSVLRPGESQGVLKQRSMFLSPYAAILICFSLIAWQVGTRHGVTAPGELLRLLGDVAGIALVTLVVVLRQNLSFHEHAALNRELSVNVAETERRATHDPLTGLPNRALLDTRLEEAICRATASNHLIAVLYIDLDRFKTINDGLGRQGGDEFMVLMPDLPGAHQSGADQGGADQGGADQGGADQDGTGWAELRAQRLMHSLSAPLPLAGRTLMVTASMGLAMFPRDGHDGAMLRKHADVAMYRAKASGRNALRRFTPDMGGGLNALELEQALRAAVMRGDFELHYQPQVHSGGAVLGMEALVRWRREGALVPPGEFISLAEETGLIVPLGTWALRQLAAWDAAGLKVPRMAVNISPRQFMVSGLLGSVRAALAETGTSPERLELELTESTVAHNLTGNIHLGDLLAQLTELRGLGVRLALDDFGTGQSSLSLLRAVPAHTLKIDQTFVAGLPADAESGAVVRTVLALARSL